MTPIVIYGETAPAHHPVPACPIPCHGVWRETTDQKRQAWVWQCDKRGCPYADRQGRVA